MDKKYYITTAIPYLNGSPHIGHTIDYLLADILARYKKQNGQAVRLSVGTDEHGSKIASKATEAGVEPQVFVDKIFLEFESLIKAIGTSYTDVVRTTDQRHMQVVQYIWQKLQPYLYKDKYEGWYCAGCEAFVTDKEVNANNGTCPDHQAPYQRISEENYFLRASAFTEPIRQALVEDRIKIYPEFRKKEFLEMIKDGLQDVSVSRPVKSLSWGIPVPGDSSQVIYVWFDALSNYLSVIGFPDGDDWQQTWPADVQVLGKDIMRFHLGIWPIILLGLGLELPKALLVHGWVNVGGSKQSKSLGNGVNPFEIIQNYGLDAFRYYFSRHIPTLDDGDFTWEKFETAYNGELANDLGNLVQRLAGMINRYQAGVIGEIPKKEHDMKAYHRLMDKMEFDKAQDEVWVKIRNLNQYIDSVEPWKIAKKRESDPEATAHLADILGYAVSALLQIADLLMPFLPESATNIKTIFETGVIKQSEQVLFPKIYLHTPDPKLKETQ